MLIRHIETYNRGFFAGACGYVDGDGDGEFSVALRKGVTLDGEMGWVHAGCGIVAGSDADDEYDEIGMKLQNDPFRLRRPVRLRAADPAAGGIPRGRRVESSNRPTGDGAVRFCVFRRAGTVGRVRDGDKPGIAFHGACHDGVRDEPALSRPHAGVCGRGRTRGVVFRAGPGEGKRPSRGPRMHVGNGAGELLSRRAGSGDVARAACRAFGRPAVAVAGAGRAANRRPGEGVWRPRALLPADAASCRRVGRLSPLPARRRAKRAWPRSVRGRMRRVVVAKARRWLRVGAGTWQAQVQVNFQLDEPLTPDLSVEGLFEAGRGPLAQATSEALDAAPCVSDAGAIMAVRQRLDAQAVRQLYALMRGRRTLVLAGEGTCETAAEARQIVGVGTALQRAAFGRPAFGIAEARRRSGRRQLRQRVRRRGVPLARRGMCRSGGIPSPSAARSGWPPPAR